MPNVRKKLSTEETIFIDRVTQSNAAHVLWVMGMEGGVQPGSFVEKLIEAMVVADTGNLDRLSHEFEGLTSALSIYKRMEGGVKILQEIAAGRPYGPTP
jgi:hypothetical protein